MEACIRSIVSRHKEVEDQLFTKHGPDFAKDVRTFSVNKSEADVIEKWLEQLKPEIMAIQGDEYKDISPDEPYYGALGGGLTYSFIPTGLGDILVVKETITGKELNVTEALDWFFYG